MTKSLEIIALLPRRRAWKSLLSYHDEELEIFVVFQCLKLGKSLFSYHDEELENHCSPTTTKSLEIIALLPWRRAWKSLLSYHDKELEIFVVFSDQCNDQWSRAVRSEFLNEVVVSGAIHVQRVEFPDLREDFCQISAQATFCLLLFCLPALP